MLVQMIAPYTNGLWQVVKQSDYLPWLVVSDVPAAAYGNSSSPVSMFPPHRNTLSLEKLKKDSLDSAAKNEGNPVYRFNSPRGYEDTFASPLEKGVEAREMPLSADKIDGIINTQPPRAGPKEGFLKPAKNIFSSSRRLLSNFKTIYLCIIKVSLRAKRSNLKSRIASPLPLLAMTRDNQFICSDIYARLYTYTGFTGFIFNPVFLLIIAFIGLKLFLSQGFDCEDISNSVFIMLPCDIYYIVERNRKAEEARKKPEKNEKERKKKEEEEKKRVKKITDKLKAISRKLKDNVLSDASLQEIYDAAFEHDIREIIIKRL